jgi:hypothetical protein
MNKLEAIIKALDMLGNITLIDLPDGGYKPVEKSCRNCEFEGTELSKGCCSCLKLSCGKWKYDGREG